jgi:hypothetical protein
MHRYWLLLLPFLFSCEKNAGDLCTKYLEPYPDLISGRSMSRDQEIYANGMQLYSEGKYDEAIDSLSIYAGRRGSEKSAYLYLAVSHLKMGRPFDAELHLDHLENSNLRDFRDQTEWYTLLCWVCSDQIDRARLEAERIAGSKHTYKAQAQKLAADLSRTSK